jgi:hypothetical protein
LGVLPVDPTDPHEIKVEWVGTSAAILVDGEIVYGPLTTSLRPTAVLFGNHPLYWYLGGAWTSWSIDEFRVEVLDSEPQLRLELQDAELTFAEAGADAFSFYADYALADGSPGLFPDLGDVQVSFGTYVETIPQAAFVCRGRYCEYIGAGPGITRAVIASTYMAFVAEDVDLSGTANPMVVAVALGEASGQVVIRPRGTLAFN